MTALAQSNNESSCIQLLSPTHNCINSVFMGIYKLFCQHGCDGVPPSPYIYMCMSKLFTSYMLFSSAIELLHHLHVTKLKY